MHRWLVKSLIMMCFINTGCLTREKEVVYVSLTPAPEAGMGILYVATNRPIPVAIQGKDIIFERDMGGWYLLPKDDLEYLVTQANK